LAEPPKDISKPISREEVARRLTQSHWACVKLKDFAAHSTWRTQYGFHFSVTHDCTEADFEDLMIDVNRYGRKRNPTTGVAPLSADPRSWDSG